MSKNLQEYITQTAYEGGAILVGYTRIRKVEPVILLGFPFSDKWFLNAPLYITKRIGETYALSKYVQNKVTDVLKREGYKSNLKTVMSLYGDFRPLAVSAGLGEWGRNGLVVNKNYGANVLYAAIFTNAPLVVNMKKEEMVEHCSNCWNCIKSCPAKAFNDSGFDSKKCFSYILKKGCSECLKVCKQ